MGGPGNTLVECEPRESVPMVVPGGKGALSSSWSQERAVYHSQPRLNVPVIVIVRHRATVFIEVPQSALAYVLVFPMIVEHH